MGVTFVNGDPIATAFRPSGGGFMADLVSRWLFVSRHLERTIWFSRVVRRVKTKK